MTKLKISQAFTAYLLANFLVMCPAFGQSNDIPPGNADASVCTTLLLDHQIAQDSKSFNPKNLWIYESDIAPLLNQVHDRLPAFADTLGRALDKKWSFAVSDFKDCPSEWAFSPVPMEKVACQTRGTSTAKGAVAINPEWFEKLDPKSCAALTNSGAIHVLEEKQKDLFLHELVLGIALGLGTKIDPDSMEQVYEMLLVSPLPSATTMQQILESAGYGEYGNQPCSPSGSSQLLTDNAAQNVSDGTHAVSKAVAPAEGQECVKALDLASKACTAQTQSCNQAADLARMLCRGAATQNPQLPTCSISIRPQSCKRKQNKYFYGYVGGLPDQQSMINACQNSDRESVRTCLDNYARVRCSSVSYGYDATCESSCHGFGPC